MVYSMVPEIVTLTFYRHYSRSKNYCRHRSKIKKMESFFIPGTHIFKKVLLSLTSRRR